MSGLHRLARRASLDDEHYARNIAEVIDELWNADRPRERRIDLIQVQIVRAMMRYKPKYD